MLKILTLIKRMMLGAKLARESKSVASASMEILKEFEVLEEAVIED